MPVLLTGAAIGLGAGLIVGGVMVARVLFSLYERGEVHYLFHRA